MLSGPSPLNPEDHHHPVRVEGLPLPVHHIASGAVHCGAICGSSRQCFMWGRGSLGRCGMGESNVLKPKAIPNFEGAMAFGSPGKGILKHQTWVQKIRELGHQQYSVQIDTA